MIHSKQDKNLIIFSMDKQITSFLYNTIHEVIGKEVNVIAISSGQDIKIKIKPDLIMLSNDELKKEALNLFPNTKMLFPKRIVTGFNLEKLFMLPKNYKVLLVNHPREATYDTIDSLIKFGINHLNYIPYEKDKIIKFDGIDTAVSPGMTHLIPNGIKNIIDIGPRTISAHSFLQLLIALELNHDYLDKFVYSYHTLLLESSRKLTVALDRSESLRKNVEVIFDEFDDGIVSVNEYQQIDRVNNSIIKLIDVNRETIINRNIGNLISSFKKIADLSDGIEVEGIISGIYSHNKSKILIKKIPINNNDRTNYIYTFREIEQMQKIEQDVRMKLQKIGYVTKYNVSDLWSKSDIFHSLVVKALSFAKTEMNILITGESGTGKELFAHVIHNNSLRSEGPFVAVNFAGLSETLIESELFGYEEGAFTGAKRGGKTGLFEQAHGGTIFLDEIGDAPLNVQSRLLRVLQEKEFMRVSGSKIVSVNVRVIAATNRNLTEAISNKYFREDLYYRINTLPLEIPPLRERKEDLIYIINKYIKNKYKVEKKISDAVAECIMAYHWPGNVRELINTTEYLFYTSASDTCVELCHLPEYIKNYYYNQIKNTGICDVFVEENAKKYLYTNVYDNEATCTLLKVLIERKNIVSGMNSLRNEMLNKNCSITEGKLKKIIRNLRELKLVSVGTTKQGTVITTEGEKYIKEVLHSRFR